MVKGESWEGNSGDIRNILEALRRHPNVLIRLGERLKTAMPEGSKRPGVTIAPDDLTTLGLIMMSTAQRRNAVSLNRSDWVAGMKKKFPRRDAVILPAVALTELKRRLQEASSSSSSSSDSVCTGSQPSSVSGDADHSPANKATNRASTTLRTIGINLLDPFGRDDDDCTVHSALTERSSIHSYRTASSDNLGERSDDGLDLDALSPRAAARKAKAKARGRRGSGSGSESWSGSGRGSGVGSDSSDGQRRGTEGLFLYDPSLAIRFEGSDRDSDPASSDQDEDALAAELYVPPPPTAEALQAPQTAHASRADQAGYEEPLSEYADPSAFTRQAPDDTSLTSNQDHDRDDDVLMVYVDAAEAGRRAAAKAQSTAATGEPAADDDADAADDDELEMDLRRFVFEAEDAAMLQSDYEDRPDTVDLPDDASDGRSVASNASHVDRPGTRDFGDEFHFGAYSGPLEEDYDSDSDVTVASITRERGTP